MLDLCYILLLHYVYFGLRSYVAYSYLELIIVILRHVFLLVFVNSPKVV